MNKRAAFGLAILLMISGLYVSAQDLSRQTMQSIDEWRWGVVAYNDGLPGKALLAMERAISLNPSDGPIREWLGRTYWRSGMEDAALSVWDALIQDGQASIFLQRRADNLRRRLSGEEEIQRDDEWVPFSIMDSSEKGGVIFDGPSAARSLGDGSASLVVASYTRGELNYFDANGALIQNSPGGFTGFNRPFDILPTGDGRLLVSEFQGDKISVVSLESYRYGYRIESWGESGLADNQFLGPQYMALSPDRHYVYITDWGNRRISKWTLDGKHVLNIDAGGGFDGFLGPSGIASYGDRVYVADSLAGRVDVFDSSGNYLGPLIESGLEGPEGLFIMGEELLIADGSKIHQVNLISGQMILKTDFGEGFHRITTISQDENGNLVVCDFDSNRVVLLTPLSTLYGGLDITLDRVRADAFPDMAVDVSVKDRSGQPLSGLDISNFRIFENEHLMNNAIVDWSASKDSSVSLAAVVDISGSEDTLTNLFDGIEEVVEALIAGDTLSFVAAADQAMLFELTDRAGVDAFYRQVLQMPSSHSVQWDVSLRLAVTQLAPERNRKTIIAFVGQKPASDAFDTYGLVQTARIMVNNGVVFYPLYLNHQAISKELDYIAVETGGTGSLLFQEESKRTIIEAFRQSPSGRYTLSWKTTADSGYGRNFLPVSVEVVYISKSGREESGSFAPLR